MIVEPTVISVNVHKNAFPEAVPRWPVNEVFREFPYGVPVRLTKYQALMVQKKHRSVVPMRLEDFQKRFGTTPEISITRAVGIGDILMLEPSLRVLADEGWDITLAVLKAFVPIVKNNPCIKHVLECASEKDVPPTKIANSLNLNMRVERIHGAELTMPRAKLFEKLVNVTVPADKRMPTLILSDSWRRHAARLVPEGAIGICVKTSTINRDYPHVQELAVELANRGRTVVLLHHQPASKTGVVASHERIIDLQNKIDCATLCAVIERCSVVITPDSGPMHIAMTLGVPCVAIEGPTDPDVYHWSYNGSPKKVLQKSLKCIACWHKGGPALNCAARGYQDHECMDWPPADVANAAEEIMRNPDAPVAAPPKQRRKKAKRKEKKEKAPVQGIIDPEKPKPAPRTRPRAKLWMTMLYQDEPATLMERFIERVVQHPAIGKVIAVNGAAESNGLSTMLQKTGKVDIFNIPYPQNFFGAQANQRNASFMPVPAGTPVLMMDPDEEMSPALYEWLEQFAGSGIQFAEIARMDWPTKAEGVKYNFAPRWTVDQKADRDWQPRLFVWQLHWHWYRAAHHILLGPPDAQRLPDDRFIMHFREEIKDRAKRERQWDSQMAENEACIGGENGMGR